MEHGSLIAKPSWLRVRAPSGERSENLKRLLTKERLHTVCSSAACPNMGECWSRGTATFMILGNQCTRACRFCNVMSKSRPNPVDLSEPERLVNAVRVMGLSHAVITSVARDDLKDGGASQFARCLNALKISGLKISCEVLVPDFNGDEDSIKVVVDAGPDIFNHNIETVFRLTKNIRSGAEYHRSLKVLKRAKELRPFMKTKSGIMLGLGEELFEIEEAMKDLLEHGCDQLTIGQYLRPSAWHHPVVRYAAPEEFSTLANLAKNLGFSFVQSGPLVRSSYHAELGVDKRQNESC